MTPLALGLVTGGATFIGIVLGIGPLAKGILEHQRLERRRREQAFERALVGYTMEELIAMDAELDEKERREKAALRGAWGLRLRADRKLNPDDYEDFDPTQEGA